LSHDEMTRDEKSPNPPEGKRSKQKNCAKHSRLDLGCNTNPSLEYVTQLQTIVLNNPELIFYCVYFFRIFNCSWRHANNNFMRQWVWSMWQSDPFCLRQVM